MSNNSANEIIDEYLKLINGLETNITGEVINQHLSVTENKFSQVNTYNHSAFDCLQQNNPAIKSEMIVNTADTTVTKKEDNKIMLTPGVLKREFLKCSRCSCSNIGNRILGEGCDFKPAVFIITDTILSEDERAYLDSILKAFHLNPETNTYITSLVKCCYTGESIPHETYIKCSKFLKMQFMLYRPLSAIAFGKSSSSFLESLKKKEEFKYTAFIGTLSPLEIKNNKEEKKKLIASFNAMAELIHIARV